MELIFPLALYVIFLYNAHIRCTVILLKWITCMRIWQRDDDGEGISSHLQRGNGWCELLVFGCSSAPETKVMNLSGRPVIAD